MMGYSIKLPTENRTLEIYELKGTPSAFSSSGGFSSRTAYSAAHVVADPLSSSHPVLGGDIDWERTLHYRRHLWSLGFGVAEAMDTAQRGMGLTWESAQELIKQSSVEAKRAGGLIASGAGTDHLDLSVEHSLDDIVRAYAEQCEFVESQDSGIILMASRALAKSAKRPEDYLQVYSQILGQTARPVILHWLGPMFDPALQGYWGEEDYDRAMDICLDMIHKNEAKVDGIKISLLDKDKEIKMRRLLPESVRMYTGDDFNYPELIAGDEQGYSHALLGIFDAIAPAAAHALRALDHQDLETYKRVLEPTVELSRHIFQTPTYAYKTGIVFMAYLNGHQSHFKMIGGAEGTRSIQHLTKLFKLMDEADLIQDQELAIKRMDNVLKLAGIEQEVHA